MTALTTAGLPSQPHALRHALRHGGERRLLWLEGEEAALVAAVDVWLEQALNACDTLCWCGEGPAARTPLMAKKALQKLGASCDVLVFNAFSGLHPDAFGALAGTLRAGGLLLLLTPPRADWPAFSDPDRLRLVSHASELPSVGQQFIARWVRCLTQDRAAQTLTTPPSSGAPWQAVGDNGLSAEQAACLPQLLHQRHGHRHRPLVLAADRGRGKSALLGIAAARLLMAEPSLVIVITAPSQTTLATLLAHASAELAASFGANPERCAAALARLSYLAPERVASGDLPPDAELLLVDEAAAIPTPLLEAMLGQMRRIIFATTEHGYEGTGRGFHLRFKRVLDKRCPGWQELRLSQPLRWSARDPLEPLLFRLLGLHASVAEAASRRASPAQWQTITQTVLAADEALLSQVFALLVLAHYQTKPSDLRLLLESPQLDIHLLRAGSDVLGVALVALEGGLDKSLAQAIWAGERRPRGHLLPQSLLAHAGFTTAGGYRYARILRLAIHPAAQRQGLGQQLVTALQRYYRASETDFLGAAFAASADLLPFWRRNGFCVLRFGLQRDAASGSHSALVLQALSARAQPALAHWQPLFLRQLPSLLAGPLRALDAHLVAQALANTPPAAAPDVFALQEARAFAFHHKPFALAQASLHGLLAYQLPQASHLSPATCALLIASVWQYADLGTLAKQYSLAGKPALVQALRQAVALLLTDKA
ncbi:MAG: tRNA(Met) cytidine acetyltransferase TmcA [Aeromonas sp.]